MRFDELNLSPEIMDGISAMNYQDTTPVQEATIPVILTGRDVISCAQTGTGKTAAYILPLLDMLITKPNKGKGVRAIIIAPTRELAGQIDMQFEGFSYFLPISTISVSGGGDGALWDKQKKAFTSGADVVIATPGRMISHLQNSKVSLSNVEYLILDEADRMLDMGFYDDIMKISEYLPKERQTLLFSATMPPKIRKLANTILNKPLEVNIAISKPNEAIKQLACVCYNTQKSAIIKQILNSKKSGKTIIFAGSKLAVKELAFTLKRLKFNVRGMHSDLEQSEREGVMLDFTNGKFDILVATDIVARGIDITNISLVVNYDVPHDEEDYIHRIGRTARGTSTAGEAITLVNEKEQYKFKKIEEFLGYEIEKMVLPTELGEQPAYNPPAAKDNFSRGGKRNFRGGKGGGGNRRPKSENSTAKTEHKDSKDGAKPNNNRNRYSKNYKGRKPKGDNSQQKSGGNA